MKIEEQHRYEKVILGLELPGSPPSWRFFGSMNMSMCPFAFSARSRRRPGHRNFGLKRWLVLLVATGVVLATLLGLPPVALPGKFHPGLRLVP